MKKKAFCLPTKQLSLAVAISLTLIGCGDLGLSSFESRKVTRAPASASEVGVIVNGATEVELAQLLADKPEAGFRVIHQARGLYEVFGASEAEVAQRFASAPVFKNEFIPAQQSASAEVTPEERIQALNETASEQRMNPCKTGAKKPKADLNLKINGQKVNLFSPLIKAQLGDELEFDGSASAAHTEVGETVKVAFGYGPPEDSLQKETIVFEPKMKLKPDSYGLYEVIMVVQDKLDTCEYRSMAVAVTGDQPLKEKVAEPTQDLSQFLHLNELQAQESWKVSTGEGILIAVVDTGVNYNHPDLRKNIAINAGEIAGNGLDDDNNGFIDDVYGYDFSNDDPFAFDDAGHGSHVAGLAAASSFGLAKGARILPVKALGATGGDMGSILGAILYAAESGAQVINLSLGYYAPTPNPQLVEVMNQVEEMGALVIAASGNGHPQLGIGMSTDTTPNYPSALDNANIVAVASKASKGLLAPYSNFGAKTVDVTAPGGAAPNDFLLSSYFENPKQVLHKGLAGTSMASPIVAGVAAQVWALRPEMTAVQVKDVLMKSGTLVDGLEKVTVSGRYINALQAVQYTPDHK